MKKTIIITLSFVFISMASVAQQAYSDLINALNYSQNGPAHAAFDGSGQYYNYYWSHTSSGYISGTTVSSANSGRRAATNMSNVGLKISSSGYNRGAELARYYAEMRAERARIIADRRQRMVNSYMQTQYEHAQAREATWQMYIANNSQAKPFSQEAIYDFVSNGLPGNIIIDDNGVKNMLPEALLEGAESMIGTVDMMEEKPNNEEELSDEELDFLLAQALERKAELEEEKRQLEESIAEMQNEESRGVPEIVNNQQDGENGGSMTGLMTEKDELNATMESPVSLSVPESLDRQEEGLEVGPSNIEESIAFLPEGCDYTVLLQPSNMLKGSQMVFGDTCSIPLLRMDGRLYVVSNDEVEELAACKLPEGMGDDENAFALDNQLMCKCGASVKKVDGKKENDVFSLSDTDFNIYPAFDESFYIVKHQADSSFVYLFDMQSKKFSKQFNTPFKIDNLVGTGTEGFVTYDNKVYHVSNEVRVLGEVAGAKVQSVAFFPEGAFFSTGKACYYMGLSGKTLPFFSGNVKQVMLLDNRLFLLFEDGMLAAIDNANKIAGKRK